MANFVKVYYSKNPILTIVGVGIVVLAIMYVINRIANKKPLFVSNSTGNPGDTARRIGTSAPIYNALSGSQAEELRNKICQLYNDKKAEEAKTPQDLNKIAVLQANFFSSLRTLQNGGWDIVLPNCQLVKK